MVRSNRNQVVTLIVMAWGGFISPAFAWWDTGHEHITVGAIQHLPQPLRGFFEANLNRVRDWSGLEPGGAHYINIDLYPEFFDGTFPRVLDDAVALYGNTVVTNRGKGPWTYTNYVSSLTSQMSAAQTPANWTNQVGNNLLRTAAELAHYIEDLHNPLHLTANYNGQATGNNGIHARYEGEMVERHLDELTFSYSPAQYLPSVLDFVFDGIDEHYYYVDDILAADDLYPAPYNTAYYNGMWAETGEFTKELFQKASEAVANSWYTAWVNAGSPKTFLKYSADFNADGVVNSADLLEWQAAFGVTASGDADGDGDADGRDFLSWQRQVGSGELPMSGIVAVPEPVGLTTLFLFIGWVGVLRPFRSCGH